MNKKKKDSQIQYVEDPITSTAIINQANGVSISEGSKKKAQRLFTDPKHSTKIKTFAILTFYNRDKLAQTKKVNKNQNKILKGYLGNKDSVKINDEEIPLERILKQKTPYYKVKGKYGNVEKSIIIYNISFNEAYHLAQLGGQQSFIWGTNDNGKLKFEFWANASKTEGKYEYKKVDEKDDFDLLDDNAEDYYTQISKDFKFSIPFDQFEVSQDELIEKYINSGLSNDDIEYYINESMRDNYNEKFRQNCRLRLTRGSMNSGGNSNMSKIEENINPYLKEDVSQSPTKEDISYLYDWLELDKEKYLKLWDEKNGHAYIVFGANFQRFLDEDDPNSIFQWLKDHNFKYNITIGDYTYKTVGKFDGVSMRTIGKGYDRTLKNRVKLDIYWDTQKGDKLNNSLEEDEQPKYPKVDISHLHDSEIKKLVRSSYKASQKERQDFNFATSIDKEATLVKEVERAVLLQLTYYTWNTERTGKVKKSILAWFPKSALLNSLTPHSKARVVENIGQLIKSNSKGIRESVAGSESEYFTKEEIKTLPNELAKFFQEQKTPKYYDISVEDMGDKKYVLRGNIDYGEINHDHRYFDTKAKEFFDDKGIQVDIYEPDDLKGTIDEDGIYSSGHIIQKQGNMVYKPQDNELDNFLDDERE